MSQQDSLRSPTLRGSAARSSAAASNWKPSVPPIALQAQPGGPKEQVPPPPVEFHYTQSDSFVDLLNELGATLLVSTYQANKLLAVRASGEGLSTLVRTFDRPMGLAADSRRLALGTRSAMWQFRNAPDIAPRVEPAGRHDACYVPRSSHITGDIGIHEIAWVENELWLVSTRFSCLCTLSPDYSFVPRWQPPFITAMAAEDRVLSANFVAGRAERMVIERQGIGA